MDKTWNKIVILWLTGVVAAAQLAKFSALSPLLRAAFGLDLQRVSLLISLLEVGGALLGFLAGLALPRIGSHRALIWGLGILAAATLCEGFASHATALFTARAVEGLGYLLVVIGAPTLIVAEAGDGPRRGQALTLWSSFVPVGIGLGSATTGAAASLLGLRGAILIWVIPCLLLLLPVLRLDRRTEGQRRRAMPALAGWLLAVGFGCYTLFLCALTGLLPAFLVERHGVSVGLASLCAGAVSFAALPGSLLALPALRLTADRRRGWALPATAMVAAALLAPWVYRIADVLACTVIAVAMVMLSGVTRTLLFTRLPVLSGSGQGGDPRLAAAQGLLTQCGAAGALLGPPLAAWVIGRGGWTALGWLIAGLMVMLGLLFVAAETCWGRSVTSDQA